MADDELRACARCGTVATVGSGGLPHGWSLATGERGVTFTCGTCTRANLRAIEGKLGEEWWEG